MIVIIVASTRRRVISFAFIYFLRLKLVLYFLKMLKVYYFWLLYDYHPQKTHTLMTIALVSCLKAFITVFCINNNAKFQKVPIKSR